MLDTEDKAQLIRSVMKAIYNLSDEDNYSVYDAIDVAEYLGLDQQTLDGTLEVLWEAGCLQECMTLEDDGATTYVLTDKAIDLVEMG